MPVYQMLANMPTSELYQWFDFYADKSDEAHLAEQRAKGNLMVMGQEDILRSAGL
jgi:hypothetical protein